MTNFTKNMMIAAAAMLVAAGVAGAQTIKAEVPFGFRVANKVMPAGAYRVSASRLAGGSLFFTLTNEEANRSVMTVPNTSNNKRADTTASLTFECSGADCALIRVAAGNGQAYNMQKPKMGNEDTHLAVIRAVLVSAE